MRILRRRFDRISAVALIAAMLPFTAGAAPKTVNPETIHRKIVERGTGRWICVDLKNGTLHVRGTYVRRARVRQRA